MNEMRIGILHPGAMGSAVGASLVSAGHEVYWASKDRSEATRKRADSAGLLAVDSLQALCETCAMLISVCPPHAAEAVSQQVLDCGFTGTYLDANAVSPQTACRIGAKVVRSGATFADGGIIGGPPREPGSTWLYVSGPEAENVAGGLSGGPLEVAAISEEPGKASALKMCYAAYTKGTTALLSAILAAAEMYGVRPDLQRQWSRGGSRFADETAARVCRTTAKAWRFIAEMEEIADTFESAGLPAGFHRASADIYQRMNGLEKAPTQLLIEDVLARLLNAGP